jgi:hypothetical protein
MSCSEIALSFLLSWGFNLTAPNVEIVPVLIRPGLYVDGTAYIREDRKADCGVWVHEYVHAWQEQAGSAKGYYEREIEAHKIEMSFRGGE